MKNVGNEYPWQGMLIITLLMIFGGTLLYFTGLNEVDSFDALYDYVYNKGFEIIICLFFISVGLYCWILFIRNKVIKPKKEILYFLEIDDHHICTFIDKKGNKFYYENNDYKLNTFYEVLKTHDYIHEILKVSEKTFRVPSAKDKYFLNFYSVIGNFENLFLLPIFYVIALPGVISIIMSKGWQKLYGIFWIIIPGFFIVYDLVYKIKKRKNSESEMENNAWKAEKILEVIVNGIQLIMILAFNVVLFWLFSKSGDTITRIIFLPFCLCGVCVFLSSLAGLLNNEYLSKLFNKFYVIVFLLYWFGMVGFFTYGSWVQEKSIGMVLFTIPFWLVGFFAVYKLLIRKGKNNKNKKKHKR